MQRLGSIRALASFLCEFLASVPIPLSASSSDFPHLGVPGAYQEQPGPGAVTLLQESDWKDFYVLSSGQSSNGIGVNLAQISWLLYSIGEGEVL